MVEIAISLAVIGIALVAIIGVLPIGLRMQREGREATLINQDATVLMENIRNGARGLYQNNFQGDLTNYVYAITNAWTLYNQDGTMDKSGVDGYDYLGSSITSVSPAPTFPINSNSRIVGLLSIPEFCDVLGRPLPGVVTNTDGLKCFSNHVVAYVRSMSGSAAERPPQDNALLRQSSFGYRVVCQNLPSPMFLPLEWQSTVGYGVGDRAFDIVNGQVLYWQAAAANTNVVPGTSPLWQRDGYTGTMVANARELRLTFLWPQLPNGNVGSGHWTYRASIAGNLAVVPDTNSVPAYNLFFFQPQNFTTNAP